LCVMFVLKFNLNVHVSMKLRVKKQLRKLHDVKIYSECH